MQLGLCLKGPVSTILAVHDEAGNVAAVALLQKLESAPLQTTCMDTARIGMKLMTLVVTGNTPRVASTPGMARRGDLCTATFAHMHKAHADCPHIYLDLLATDPSQQGKGHGGVLLRAINRVADAAGVPIYLESAPSNRSLYEHFGCLVVGKTTLQDQRDKGKLEAESSTAGGSSWPPTDNILAMVCPAKSVA